MHRMGSLMPLVVPSSVGAAAVAHTDCCKWVEVEQGNHTMDSWVVLASY